MSSEEGKTKKVHDLEWQKSFLIKAVQSKRDIVPLYFSGTNSMDFYRKANLRKRLGIKFNLEQILLPRELFNNCGATFNVYVGPMKPYSLIDIADARGYADAICAEVYRLPVDFKYDHNHNDPTK